MEAKGCFERVVRAECLQPARCYTRESLFVGNPRSRVLSTRLRLLVCDNLSSPELQVPRLAADGGRSAPQVSTDYSHSRRKRQPELAPEDEHDGQSGGSYLEPIGSTSRGAALLDAMQREMSHPSQGLLDDGEGNRRDS